jgi:uncharacterized membrane protein
MTKREYLKKLNRALRRVEPEERKKSLAYFGEVTDDRIEEGVSEADAVAELESVEAAAERILAETGALGQLKPRRSVWEIALLVLGFPLWLPVLLTGALVLIVVYGLVWLIISMLFLLSAALVACSVCSCSLRTIPRALSLRLRSAWAAPVSASRLLSPLYTSPRRISKRPRSCGIN